MHRSCHSCKVVSPLESRLVHAWVLTRTVASSLEVVRPYCVVIITTPTFAYSLVQVPHKCGTAMAVPGPYRLLRAWSPDRCSSPARWSPHRLVHAWVLTGVPPLHGGLPTGELASACMGPDRCSSPARWSPHWRAG